MKKLLSLALAAALALSLTACGGGGEKSGGASSSKSGGSSSASSGSSDAGGSSSAPGASSAATPDTSGDGASSSAPSQSAPAPLEEIVMGQTYTGTDCELTFNEISFTKKCSVQTGSHSSTYQEAAEGNTLIAIDTSVKNTGTEAMDTWNTKPYEGYALYDGKYKYEASSIFVGANDIAPLSTSTECMIIEIPADLENAAEPLVVFLTIGGVDYQYTIR